MPLDPDGRSNSPQSIRALVLEIILTSVTDGLLLDAAEQDIHKEGFCSQAHRTFCRKNGFVSGMHELDTFWRSPWCETLLDHLEQDPDYLRSMMTTAAGREEIARNISEPEE